jgi:phosphoglycerol transferase MdoB-like AlkP superfamily enzyme
MEKSHSKLWTGAAFLCRVAKAAHIFLARRSFSVMIFGALLCTLLVKFFQSLRIGQLPQYPQWVLSDIAVLLSIDIVLTVVCFFWPRRLALRLATIIAAIICTWSFINAGWLLRTGKQFLPLQLFPLVRDPYTTIAIVAENLIKMPLTMILLLSPLAAATIFLAAVLVRPKLPAKNYARFIGKALTSGTLIITCAAAYTATAQEQAGQSSAQELRYNSQLKAVTSSLLNNSLWQGQSTATLSRRTIPNIEQATIAPPPKTAKQHNIVLIVLEGVQYRHTSLYDKDNNLTPYLKKLADDGVEFSNTRSSFTHTTKALFALLSGRHPSPSQDITETIPVDKPYVSLASILKDKQQYRTAFFQSAKGEFESSPGLAHNLGFDKFWSRECIGNSESFLGYQSCDDFVMIRPITEWIKSSDKPFLLTVMCSVSHDPYIVPKWFATPAKEPLKRYQQTINYTDSFIKAIDGELARLNLTDNTIFCVVSDHGEGFGEHGLFAHEGIGYEESMRVPLVIRAPQLVKAGTKIDEPVSSIDLTPTLLCMLGFNIKANDFDGVNVVGNTLTDRKVFFVGGMYYGPTGYVKGDTKYIYDEITDILAVYNLKNDPLEKEQIVLAAPAAGQIADDIKKWRKDHILQIDKSRRGKIVVYDDWVISWGNTICRTKYKPQAFAKAR